MKLLAVSTSCWSAANRELYRRLNTDGYEILLVVPSFWNFGSENLDAEPKLPEDPPIELLEPSSFHHRLYRLKGIKSLIAKFKPEGIYYEGDPGSLMCAILGRIAKKNNIKLFALSNENLSQNPLAVVKREGKKQFFNALVKYSLIQYSKRKIECLFVINKKGLSYFQSIGFKRVVQTPLGFNETYFKIDEETRLKIRQKLGIEQGSLVVAYFGRLVYEKGLHLLTEALENLDFKEFKLLIDKFSRYADPYQTKVYNSIMSSSLKENTLFFEAKHLEIANYMNIADITILPSISTGTWLEQYGRVVPEAMACGSLVIVSDVGAPKDFFEEDYPFIFSSGNVNDLEAKINLAKKAITNTTYDRNAFSKRATREYSLIAQIEIFKSHINTD